MALPTLAAALIFPSISALAGRILLGYFLASNAGAKVEAQCPPNPGAYNLTYTTLPALDGVLCFMITFFHAALSAPVFPFLAEFGSSWAALIILPTIESSRHGRARIFAPLAPIAFGLVYQLAGAGVLFPLFWLAMVWSGHARMRAGPRASIDQASAEANLFALVVGYIGPSVAMCALEKPTMTALWQPFPLWIGLARGLYLLVRPPPRASSSGYTTVQATFALTFLFSAIVHTTNVWPVRHDASALSYVFVPRSASADASLGEAVLGLLQWDMYLTLGSGMLGALWFAESVGQGVGMMVWSVGASLAFGPGAAMSGLLMSRERRLNGGAEVKGSKRG